MPYLLVSHIPLGRGEIPGTIRLGDLWLQDLRAQVKAIGAFDRFMLAAPLIDEPSLQQSASFNQLDITPEDEGFEYFPLPYFRSLKDYFKVRSALKRRLAEAVDAASIVHATAGGHPVPHGQIVWPIAGKAGKKRIFVFDGGDVFAFRHDFAMSDRNPIRRAIRLRVNRRYEAFCRQTIGEADLVFMHNPSVAARFRAQGIWNSHCHLFHRTYVTEQLLITDEQAEQRQAELLDRSRPLRLAAIGRQIAIKATDQVIQAVDMARKQGVQVHLDVIGDGVELGRYKQVARDLAAEDAVTFHGSLPYGPELFELWKQSHITVITNVTTEFSRNILLSMASGLPILAYRNDGHDELIESNDAGVLVPCGNVDALAEAIIDLDRNRQRLVDVMANGRTVAQARTHEQCHRQRAACVQELIASGQKE